MNFDIGVTLPAVYDCDIPEAIERAAQAGADSVEFYDWTDIDIPDIRETAAKNGVGISGTVATGIGSNVGNPDAGAMSDPAKYEQAVEDIERSIVATAELGGDTLILTVGPRIDTLSEATQQNTIVQVLRSVVPTAKTHDIMLVVEPLNTRVNHPDYFLRTADKGFAIVEAVDSPNVKLLYDVYHQQITEGNIIQTLREHIDLVGHIHIADVPGRHEPGTGELDYYNILAAIDEIGYERVVACEFTPSGERDDPVEHVVTIANNV
jgi:hydroxypyruvate isomerase